MAFSPDGKTLASGSQDKTVRLVEPGHGQNSSASSAGTRDGVRSVAFSRDGKMLASVSEHAILLWDPATGKPIPHKVNKLAFDGLSHGLVPGWQDRGGGRGAWVV